MFLYLPCDKATVEKSAEKSILINLDNITAIKIKFSREPLSYTVIATDVSNNDIVIGTCNTLREALEQCSNIKNCLREIEPIAHSHYYKVKISKDIYD